MATSLIVTPNNVQHRVKDNSWYVLHVMPDSRDEYAILDPVSYKRDDGSMRYKAKIPVLLSITSTEENEVFMDVSDVFRCYKIPYSRYLRLQMYVDGDEVKPPGCHGNPNISQHKAKDNSWYVLYLKKCSIDNYEKLDPEECRLDDGRIGFKAKIPMLAKTDDKGNEFLMSLGDICKLLNVPGFYGHFLMYVDGVKVDHQIIRRFYTLPAVAYYVGDPCYVLEEKYELFKKNNEMFFEFLGHSVISIGTGGDGGFRVYNLNECGDALDDDGCEVEAGTPVYADSLLVDTGTIAFIPLEILGVSLEEAIEGKVGENGLIVTREPDDDEDIKSLDVEITYTFSCNRESVDTVRFSCYEVLIADQEKYEDF